MKAAAATEPRLRGRPDRVFVSVDQSTGTSTISFAPAEVGTPVQHGDDKTGATAMAAARTISARYPGCTVHGPHFHDARPVGGRWRPRRPRAAAGTESGHDSTDD